MLFLRRYFFDSYNQNSLAWRLRVKRFAMFRKWLAQFPKPLRILDVGGTLTFWNTMKFEENDDIHIVLLNLEAMPVASRMFTSLAGDATDLSQFKDGEFDIVFSNSVIEHVGGDWEQQKMASEIMRVGKAYFVQTPNLYFPIESHSCIPLFQFMPMRLRALLLYYFDLTGGGIQRTMQAWKARLTLKRFDRLPCESWERCVSRVEGLRLLSGRKFKNMFPGSQMYQEKCLGLTKSFILYTNP